MCCFPLTISETLCQLFVSYFGNNTNVRKQKTHFFVSTRRLVPAIIKHQKLKMREVGLLEEVSPIVLTAHKQCVAEFLSPEREDCFDLCSNSVADSDFVFNGPCQKPNEANAKIPLSFNKLQFRPITEWIYL